MKLENKTIIVTGSGRGIGEYISKRLGSEGANVVVTARTEDDIKSVSKRINDNGGKAIFIRGDVTVEKDVKNVIRTTIAQFGKIMQEWD
jgi:NAD(P)-dependent dehydrogenase (short-subunit alcohol dehydrogenase family)